MLSCFPWLSCFGLKFSLFRRRPFGSAFFGIPPPKKKRRGVVLLAHFEQRSEKVDLGHVLVFFGGISSRGPCPANKLLHTYPPPYIFFHLPSSTLIRFHHFSTFLSVHLIRFFIIIFPKFSPSFSPFSSPHSFHQLPSKMSFPQSPHLIHFKKINFAKYIAKNICHQKNIRTV